MTLRYCRCCGALFDADAPNEQDTACPGCRPFDEWVPFCPTCRSVPVPTLADVLPYEEDPA